jgi:hypothetical protein
LDKELTVDLQLEVDKVIHLHLQAAVVVLLLLEEMEQQVQ